MPEMCAKLFLRTAPPSPRRKGLFNRCYAIWATLLCNLAAYINVKTRVNSIEMFYYLEFAARFQMQNKRWLPQHPRIVISPTF